MGAERWSALTSTRPPRLHRSGLTLSVVHPRNVGRKIAHMSTSTITDFVFVDFENVPTVDLSAVSGGSVHITLLIGNNQKKLEVSLVRQIQRIPAHVQLIEVGASGRNALDLTLAYHLGRTASDSPQAQFHIVSKDKDFDPLITHLRTNGIVVTRHDSFAALPFLPSARKPAAAKTPSTDRRARVITRLKNPGTRNRPSNRRALFAHVKTALGKEGSDSSRDDIVRELLEQNVLTIDSKGDVRYAG